MARLSRKYSKVIFCLMMITATGLLLGLDQSMGADDMIVAVDKSTLLKAIGLIGIALLGEIWRSIRSLYKITAGHGEKINKIEGYCKGKNKDCGHGGEEDAA